MTRTDNDTWDPATSVGATATGVAVGRALASRDANALINDPFAEPLVRAVGIDFFTRLVSGELDPAQVNDTTMFSVQTMRDLAAVRTRFVDDFFTDATDAGVGQAVIVASGLDARAYRLTWPAGTIVYDVDQPNVIEFKTTTLSNLGAAPTAERRAVGVDLRHDWPAALQHAGLDPSKPIVWCAEGLLSYLPPETQDALLDNITALSAPGSRLAIDDLPDATHTVPTMNAQIQQAVQTWRTHGFDIDLTDMFYPGERTDVTAYLNAHGWNATTEKSTDFFAVHGLASRTADGVLAAPGYVTATRN